MKFFEVLLVLAGLGLCLFGALFMVGGIAAAVDPQKEHSGAVYLLFTFFFGFAPAALGIGLCFYAVRRAVRRRRESGERTVLQLAQQRGGRLTVAEVAMNTDLSSDQAKRILEQCHLDRLCQMDVSDSGIVEYIFDTR